MYSQFDNHLQSIDQEMELNEFFTLLVTITEKIGCKQTIARIPGRFFLSKPPMIFPLTIKIIDENAAKSGSYPPLAELTHGRILLEINEKPVEEMLEQMRKIASADALNPYFIDSQIMKCFSLLFASVQGLPDQYRIKHFARV